MTTLRRYDIDWVRVIAIGLLLVYHVAIGLQPWGLMIGFITNTESWNALWVPMAMLNIWRIPLLFFVSGMGVYFALRQRSVLQLLGERTMRILVPFLFGMFVIFPISKYVWQRYYQFDITYDPNPGHLWFLGNIFAYVVLLSPLFFYLKKNENSKLSRVIRKIFSSPLGLVLVVLSFVVEAILIDPKPYEMYAFTWHGFALGLLAFFFGFCFMISGRPFWDMMLKWRWLFLAGAVTLFVWRLLQFQMRVPFYLLVAESDCWIFSVMAFAYRYLNRDSKTLSYLSQAAYPVYILHMIFLFGASAVLFPLAMAPWLKFSLVLISTGVGCFVAYEIIRRVNILRPLFGLKMTTGTSRASESKSNTLKIFKTI